MMVMLIPISKLILVLLAEVTMDSNEKGLISEPWRGKREGDECTDLSQYWQANF